MDRFFAAPLLALTLAAPAFAWTNHSLPTYRALEQMPEVAGAAAVTVEPLEAFLKAEEKAVEALLASQESWAVANLDPYPARPPALAFVADAGRSDAARRLAFLRALRIAPDSRFALYLQPDPWHDTAGPALAYSAVHTLPESSKPHQRFIGIQAGDRVAPLAVIASAADEPDYGLDINLWQDSPSAWGKEYGFGKQPFGNPALSYSTQAPFHMGFFHEDRILYLAAPFIRRTFPLLRLHQYSTLAALAFRSGHPYWGWRFAGLALHYLQDLTQPYHASLAPGEPTWRLIGINLLAMLGKPGPKDDMIVLLSNRHLALENYQYERMSQAARQRRESALEQALHDTGKDRDYPAWDEHTVRDVVAAESHRSAPQLSQVIVATLPAHYVSDPAFDFGAHESELDLLRELDKEDPARRQRLESATAELLGHFGAHTRNAVRAILQAGGRR